MDLVALFASILEFFRCSEVLAYYYECSNAGICIDYTG